MANWAELLPDLLIRIANRIDSFEDFVAFGGVCSSWRSVAVDKNFNTASRQLPWLMLAAKKEAEEEDDDNDSNMREFFSLSKGMIHKIVLPEARGKRCMESLGWFVTVAKDGEMGLLHPFSRIQIALPHQTTFKYQQRYEMEPVHFIHKAVLSASPSLTPDYVVMVIHGAANHLGFWRPGDKTWTVIETRNSLYEDVIYYKGQFYALDNLGSIVVCDVGGPNPTVARIVGGIPPQLLMATQPYMVESAAGALLVVARHVHHPYDDPIYETNCFEVYEVDLSNNQRWQKIKCLGGRALFLGHSASISVEASRFFPTIKPNCIYYTDDYSEMYADPVTGKGGGKDMGIYNLEDGSKEPLHYKGKSLSFTCPPIWVLPSF